MKQKVEAPAAIKSDDATVCLSEAAIVPSELSATPRSFAEMIGQKELLKRLIKLVELARSHQQPLGHTLLVGPDGCGKSTTARIIARELGVNLREVPSQIERAGDLNAMIADLDEGDVFFVQNIGRLRRELISVIAGVMRDFELNIVIGKGPGARAMRLSVKPFTLVGTVEKQSDCSRDLLNAFHMVLPFQPYSEAELVEFTVRLTAQAGIALEPPTEALIARLSNGNLARAEMMMSKIKLIDRQPINEDAAREMFSLFGFDSRSLSEALPEGISTDWVDLSGIEFEKLIASHLGKMGFVVVMTKASGDGGVDIEATLDRPIIGGRYLFQCKRFAPDNLIGSPTVREFYGALVADRKAVKGILITTSGFTPQAREFAANLHIELIDGNSLAQLLREDETPKGSG